MTIKRSKIRESARGEECTIQTPLCTLDPMTTVLCHAPHRDKGLSLKGPDDWAAYGCNICHDILDGRFPQGERSLTRPKLDYWYWAVQKTQKLLKKKGLL